MNKSDPALQFSWPTADDEAILRAISTRDWSNEPLVLGIQGDEQLAARAMALGAVVCHPFAHMYALAGHPAPLVGRHINELLGRAPEQAGSVITTRDYLADLFDWSKVPPPLSRARVLEMTDTLLGLGPFGFRGPAAPHLPDHLTSLEGEVRTVQVIGSGYRCASTRLLAHCLEAIDQPYLSISDEGAHARIEEVQRAYGDSPGVVLLAQPNEERVRRAYASYRQTPTTVLAIHKLARRHPRPRLVIEREGSLQLEDVRLVLESLRLDVELAPGRQQHAREKPEDPNESLVA